MSITVQYKDEKLPVVKSFAVKTSPSSTIAQILESACKHFGVSAAQHQLFHKDKALDSSLSLRLAALPQGTKLQLNKAALPANPSGNVSVVLQLADGSTLKDEVKNHLTLWQVLEHFESTDPEKYNFTKWHGIPKEEKNELFTFVANVPGYMSPVVTFVDRRFQTVEELKSHTLSQIGLHVGSGKLKLTHKYEAPKVSPEEAEKVLQRAAAKFQAAVAEIEAAQAHAQSANASSSSVPPVPQGPTRADIIAAARAKAMERVRTFQQLTPEQRRGLREAAKIGADRGRKLWLAHEGVVTAAMFEVPDDFYEYTPAEVQTAARALHALNNPQQAVQAQPYGDTQAEPEIKTLDAYEKTKIRVKLPHRLYLEGTFLAVESVADIEEFVRSSFSALPASATLVIAPPRRVLSHTPNASLYELGLVPGAIVHLSDPSFPPLTETSEDARVAWISSALTANTAGTLVRMSPPVLPDPQPTPSQAASIDDAEARPSEKVTDMDQEES